MVPLVHLSVHPACSGAWSPRRWPCKGRQTHAGKACWQRARDSRYFNILQDGRGACHVEERYASCAPSGVWAGRPVRQAGKGRFMVLKARSSPSMPHHGRISKWEGPGGAGFGGFYLYLGNTCSKETFKTSLRLGKVGKGETLFSLGAGNCSLLSAHSTQSFLIGVTDGSF